MTHAKKIIFFAVAMFFALSTTGLLYAETYTGQELNDALKLSKSNLKKIKKDQYVSFHQDHRVVLIGLGHDKGVMDKVKKAGTGGLIWCTGKGTYEVECKKGRCDQQEVKEVMKSCGVKRKNVKWR